MNSFSFRPLLIEVCASISLALLGILTRVASADEKQDLCALAPVALERASAIRGLSLKTQVPCSVQDRDAVKGFLDQTIERDLPPRKLEMEQVAYQAIGMIPDTYEYGSGLIQFLVSQLGGYYDPKTKRFVMAAWIPALLQETVAVHELTHALQDQYYDLEKLLDPTSDNSDRAVARSALIEGDATAVMIDNQRRLGRLRGIEHEPSVDALVLQQVLGASLGSGTGGVPESIRAMLIFPYTSGLRFVHTLLRHGGYARVGQAYAELPTSTREILHPEEYLARSFRPQIPQPAELQRDTQGAVLEYTDVIGEFGIVSLLANGVKSKQRAAQAGAGWIGDRVGVFAPVDSAQRIVWLTRWESVRDAQEFYDAYRGFLEECYNVTEKDGVVQVSPAKSVRISRREQEVAIQVTVQVATATPKVAPPH